MNDLSDAKCRALLVHDAKDDPAAVRTENVAAQHGDTLTIDLSAGGGFIGRFAKE